MTINAITAISLDTLSKTTFFQIENKTEPHNNSKEKFHVGEIHDGIEVDKIIYLIKYIKL